MESWFLGPFHTVHGLTWASTSWLTSHLLTIIPALLKGMQTLKCSSKICSQFISCVWQAFFKLLGVTVSLSSGYHPQTNSQTEQKIQEIGRYLRSCCHQNQDSWSCCHQNQDSSCSGRSTPRTPLDNPPPGLALDTNLRYSPGQMSLSTTGSRRARE